eukprot:COSAG02_NODE_7670_length_2901_cov_60.433262_4_plen_106_part_00
MMSESSDEETRRAGGVFVRPFAAELLLTAASTGVAAVTRPRVGLLSAGRRDGRIGEAIEGGAACDVSRRGVANRKGVAWWRRSEPSVCSGGGTRVADVTFLPARR